MNVRTWLRKVTCPIWPWAIPLVLFFLLEWAFKLDPHDPRGNREMAIFQLIILFATMFIYGAFRVIRSHPVYHPSYWNWLETTPWTSKRALPIYPIHLVFQDLVIPGTGAALLLFMLRRPYCPMVSPAFLFLTFMVSYLLALCYSFFITEQIRAGFLTAFGFGFMIIFLNRPWIALLISILFYIPAWLGIYKSLALFPWIKRKITPPSLSLFTRNLSIETFSFWPYNALSPVDTKPRFSLETKILASLLPGWFLFSLLIHLRSEEETLTILLFFPGIFVFLCFQLQRLSWSSYYRSPTSFWGRIFTLRLIIPGYDKMSFAPFLILAVGFAVPLVFLKLNIPWYINIPLSFSVIFFFALNLGPSLAKFQLTGHYSLYKGKPGLRGQMEI